MYSNRYEVIAESVATNFLYCWSKQILCIVSGWAIEVHIYFQSLVTTGMFLHIHLPSFYRVKVVIIVYFKTVQRCRDFASSNLLRLGSHMCDKAANMRCPAFFLCTLTCIHLSTVVTLAPEKTADFFRASFPDYCNGSQAHSNSHSTGLIKSISLNVLLINLDRA